MTLEHKNFIHNIHEYTRILKWKCWIRNVDNDDIHVDLIDFFKGQRKLQAMIPKDFFSERHLKQLKQGNVFYVFFYKNKIHKNIVKKIYFLKPVLSQIEIKKRKEILNLLQELK